MNDRKPQNTGHSTTSRGYHSAGSPSSVVDNGRYVSGMVAQTPITQSFSSKTAQTMSSGGGSAANVMYGQPMFFSPLHTPQNWQIASKRREIYQWARFYYENEPKISAGIDFYSQFPMNGFTLECKDKKILNFFNRTSKRVKLNYWVKAISFENFLLGDVFPFVEYECEHCGGSGYKSNGEVCNHPGGTIKSIKILNPDWITVHSSPMASDPVYVLEPDDELKSIVASKRPVEIYEKMPPGLIQAISSGQPIRLSNRCISHVKHQGSTYGTYGTSLVRRNFTYLAYKTKLMTANWIVAERLVLPVRVVKIGSENRPATQADIADVSNQIAAVVNDPNLTLVTHHNFEYEWYGACYDQNTKVLTNKGLQKYTDIIHEEVGIDGEIVKKINDDVDIMVFDPKTGKMRLEKPIEFHEYDYNGWMNHITGNKVDMCVTPNHTMLGYKRDKKTAYSMEAKDFYKLNECDRYVRCCGDFATDTKKTIKIGDYEFDTDNFLKFLGYFLSEGYTTYNTEKFQYVLSVSQSNIKNANICKEIDDCFNGLNMSFKKYDNKKGMYAWNIMSKDFVKEMKKYFGKNAYTKKIPDFIKNLPPRQLKILIDAFCKGDATYYNYKHGTTGVQIGTVSEQLSVDLLEILFKAGFSPILSNYKKKNPSGSISHMIYCNLSEESKGRFPRIKDKHCQTEYYDGKVWCFETSTGFFVTERNGKFAIQGNTGKIHQITNELEQIGKEILDGFMLNQAILNGEMGGYSSAQVGIEVMIHRLESWRNSLSEWVENNIFLPIAMMQGFKDVDESKEAGETVWLYPKLKWNDLNLRDRTSYRQVLIQLHDKGLISTQTLLEEFDIDYDQEIQRRREETALATESGQFLGQPPAAGGMGGMPPMGGDLGGGMPPMGGDLGGGMPPAGGEMGGMPGGEMGGMPVAPAGGAVAAAAQPVSPPPNFMVQKRGKGQSAQEQMQPVQPNIKPMPLTTLEQSMLKALRNMSDKIPYQLFGQYKVAMPNQPQPFVIDFAYPDVGVGVETDGEIWHEQATSRARDQQRDQKLANVGWRILRFNETAVNDHIIDVSKIIYNNVMQATKERNARNKKAGKDEKLIKEAQQLLTFENIKEEDLKFQRIDMENNLGYIVLVGV